MKTNGLIGNWEKHKDILKMRFEILTDNDLLFDEGKKEEMMENLHKKLGKTKEEFHNIRLDLYL